ncbi:gamma-aminobutyrate transporter [Escherichia coli]|uniref:Gamma-aminobutyrate transporter n=1 Tax=Escherichia coli TaxID=562 RepID=A0A2X3LR62_ECOLX|nr:gamma-aminobutyrate transporter [Escherichia coli]
MGQSSQPHELGGGLKSRHVTMLSIAGVIGASLFVGSSVAIAEAGPAVLLAYLFAGLLVVMIMRMLAEMAVATPDTGSFSTYADKAIGRWAGYTIGWLYWWFWVLVIPLEANIAAMILHSWVPGIPIWLFSLVITLALTGSNLLSVKNYGEFEFWLALCKVIAILAFIFLGAVAISGFYPYAEVSGISRLWDSGGFMPNGFGAVLSAMLITMFSFMGAEIVTIAAAESDTPEKTYCPRHQLGYLAYFYLLFMFYFCRRGINSVEYARTKSRRFLSLGTGIAQYSPCEINHGLRDITFRNQLPELGAVYRVKDALLLKPSR